MSLIKSPANGVVIKRKISDGLKEIVSLKENILLETTEKIQSIEVKREEKFIQGYYNIQMLKFCFCYRKTPLSTR